MAATTSGSTRDGGLNMLKRTVLGALCVAAMLIGGMAQAEEHATTVLRSGERVSGQQAWTTTGITVTKGQTLTFNTTGEVQLSADANDKASSAGSVTGRYAQRSALPRVLAGALIGKIGNGQPFGIGNQASFAAP